MPLFSLHRQYNLSTNQILNFKPIAIFCSCTARFVLDLVGNHKDRFSHAAAHSLCSISILFLDNLPGGRFEGTESENMESYGNMRKHVCNLCGKRFMRRLHLENHVRSHTGQRPFQCSICFKGFTQKSHIKNHERSHFKGAVESHMSESF